MKIKCPGKLARPHFAKLMTIYGTERYRKELIRKLEDDGLLELDGDDEFENDDEEYEDYEDESAMASELI